MDSATQFILGASIAGAVLSPKIGAKAVLIGGVVATLPDLDFVIPMENPIDKLTYHRGASHSLIVLTLASPVVAWITTKIFKSAAEHWKLTFFTVWLCLFTHPLLDALTTYGTQIFWPLDVGPPLAMASIFIIDPVYTLLMLAGILTIIFARNRPGRGIRTNRILLTLATVYLSLGIAGHFVVKARAEAQPELRDKRILVQPTPFNILFWQVLAVDDKAYHFGFTSPLSSCQKITLDSQPRFASPPEGADPDKSVLRYKWFTDGFYTYGSNGKDVTIRDLRIGFHPNFIFTFVIGKKSGETVTNTLPYRVPVNRLESSAIRGLINQISTGVSNCPA